jgi:hypothetical protein
VKFSEIVTMGSKHVEARGAKVLDYNAELWAAIIDFCKVRTWRWRRKTGTFATQPGTKEYDLSANNVLNASDLEEIEGVLWVVTGSKPQRLDPVTDPLEQGILLDSTDEGDPRVYFRKPGADLTLVIGDVPVNANTLRVMWRSIPAPASFAAPIPDVVPLIPAHLHPTLVKQFEVRLMEYSLGSSDEKYTKAKGELDEMTAKAIAMEIV